MALSYIRETPNCDIAQLLTTLGINSSTYMYRSSVPWLEYKDGDKTFLVNKQNIIRNKSWNEFNDTLDLVNGKFSVYEDKYYKFRMIKYDPSKNIDEYTPFYNLSNKILLTNESWWLGGDVATNKSNAYCCSSATNISNASKTSTGYYTRLAAEQYCGVGVILNSDDMGSIYVSKDITFSVANRLTGTFNLVYSMDGIEFERLNNQNNGSKTINFSSVFNGLSYGEHIISISAIDKHGLIETQNVKFQKINIPMVSLPSDSSLTDICFSIAELSIDLEVKRIILRENIESTGISVDSNSSLDELINKVSECGAVFV